MIKASELRIGNLVKSGVNMRPLMTVLQVFGDSFQGDFGNGSRGGIMLENTEGIPITEEWLKNFGFVKNGDYESWMIATQKRGSSVDLLLVALDGEAWIQLERRNKKPYKEMQSGGIRCNYVHQLQNLFFALTGRELELKK